MKIFRHKNGCLYSIQQVGRGRTITPPDDWKKFSCCAYKTNKDAPKLPPVEELNGELDLSDFIYEFDD
jgi:hypothetical protein